MAEGKVRTMDGSSGCVALYFAAHDGNVEAGRGNEAALLDALGSVLSNVRQIAGNVAINDGKAASEARCVGFLRGSETQDGSPKDARGSSQVRTRCPLPTHVATVVPPKKSADSRAGLGIAGAPRGLTSSGAR
jgi:hypothetical protein